MASLLKEDRWLIAIAFAMEALYATLFLFTSGPPAVATFIVVHLVSYLLLALTILVLHRSRENTGSLRLGLILVAGILFRLTVVPHYPIASDDIFRYMWDGKLIAHGINPYAYAPQDIRLDWLASADLPGRVNHPGLGTVYPPLAELFFLLSYLLFGESVVGCKLLMVMMDIVTIVLFVVLLRKTGRPLWFIVLYAWSPLPVLYGALDGHVDIVGIPFLVILLLSSVRSRVFAAALATAGMALVKLHPILVAPLIARLRSGWKGISAAALSVVIFVLCYVPFRGHLAEELGWLAAFGRRWEFNGGVFTVAYWLTGDNEKAHLVLSILLAVWICWLIFRKIPLTEAVFLALVGLVLLGPVVHPWYLLWLSAILVVRWSPSVFIFLGLSALSNIVVWRYVATGVWEDDPLLVGIQYIPFVLIAAWEIFAAGGKHLIVFAEKGR